MSKEAESASAHFEAASSSNQSRDPKLWENVAQMSVGSQQSLVVNQEAISNRRAGSCS